MVITHEQWIASLPRDEADLIREGDAATTLSKRYAGSGDNARASHWDSVANEAYAQRRALADGRAA
jgi:hypothetical protein